MSRSLFDENVKVWDELFEIWELLRPLPKAIAKLGARMARRKYSQTEKGRALAHRNNTGELAKARVRRYNKTQKGIARTKKYKSKRKVREHILWMQRSRYSSARLRDKKL